MDDLREELAALAHEQWADWMVSLFERSLRVGQTWVLDAEHAARWQRQMGTPYALLTEQEKDSDRAEADRVLALLAAHDDRTRMPG